MKNEKIENLALEQLRAIRGEIAPVRTDLGGLGVELRAVRHHVRGVETQQDQHHDHIASLKARLDRVERRLELADE